MKIIPTVEQIIRVMRAKKYRVNEDDLGLNIVGIRQTTEPNRFDDVIAVFWKRLGVWCWMLMPATTDPGVYWLENPIKPMGCAIVRPGHYPGLWKIGLHQGRYPALVQRTPITVIRDNDRDRQLDLGGPEETGMFGINLHHANDTLESIQVDKWSAGCQVVANAHEFRALMTLAGGVSGRCGNQFDYTLLVQGDFGLL